MLKQMGTITHAIYCFLLAIFWGGIAWYLQDFPVGAPTLWGVRAFALIATLLGFISLYRFLSKSARDAESAGPKRRETEEELVARMMAKLNGEAESPPPSPAAIPIETEHDEIVARVLKKLEAEKATREASETP